MEKRTLISALLGISPSIVLALSLTFIFASVALASEPASAANVPIRLAIPAINLDSSITPVKMHTFTLNGTTYGTWGVAQNQVGWHNLTASLGRTGNTVLSGHSDIEGRIFRDLKYVSVGDEIIAQSGSIETPFSLTRIFWVTM